MKSPDGRSRIIKEKKQEKTLRHLKKCLRGYGGWTAAAALFGGLEVLLEVFIPMLMSVIVDGGLYRELLRGEQDRRSFFSRILEVVSTLGGDGADVL